MPTIESLDSLASAPDRGPGVQHYALVIDAKAEAYRDDHIPGAVSVSRSPAANFSGRHWAGGALVAAEPESVQYARCPLLAWAREVPGILVYCDRGGLTAPRPGAIDGLDVDVLGWG